MTCKITLQCLKFFDTFKSPPNHRPQPTSLPVSVDGAAWHFVTLHCRCCCARRNKMPINHCFLLLIFRVFALFCHLQVAVYLCLIKCVVPPSPPPSLSVPPCLCLCLSQSVQYQYTPLGQRVVVETERQSCDLLLIAATAAHHLPFGRRRRRKMCVIGSPAN